MTASENVWPLVKELASALDGNREHAERVVDQLELELRGEPIEARAEIRRQMVQIVAGLSRLEVRLLDSDGPIRSRI